MPDSPAGIDHPAAIDPARLRAECEVRFTRRSGPGGQNRNKVETAVILRHRPTGFEAEGSERRSQAENGRVALFRLRVALALRLRSPGPTAPPSPLWASRLRGGRIAIRPDHDDFPAILAEALDALSAADFEPRDAAAALGCSATQVVRLIAREPRALTLVNAERKARGLHPLV